MNEFIFDNSILVETLNFAKERHGEQKRKYTNDPYWTHPYAVALMLKRLGAPTYVVQAALLHDVVEDTPTNQIEISLRFGNDVSRLVEEVTDVSKPSDGNRAARKQIDLNHLMKSSYWGATVKLADLIDNSRSIVEYDKGFARIYLKEKERLIHVLSHGHPVLFSYAGDILNLSKQVINEG